MRKTRQSHNPAGGGSGSGSGGGSGGGSAGGSGSSGGTKHNHPKAPVKHKHLSPKELKLRRQHHAANVKTKAYQKKHAAAVKHERKLRKAVGLRLGVEYVLGQNDVLDTCTATAVANSFYIATEVLPDDEQVLRLHRQAEQDFDHSIAGTLHAVMIYGFMGVRPIISPTDRRDCRPGLILGVAHYPTPHTVASFGNEWITWGGKVPSCPVCIEEIWHVGWLA